MQKFEERIRSLQDKYNITPIKEHTTDQNVEVVDEKPYIKTVTRYRSSDGREHDTPQEATERSAANELRELLDESRGITERMKMGDRHYDDESMATWSLCLDIKRHDPKAMYALIETLKSHKLNQS